MIWTWHPPGLVKVNLRTVIDPTLPKPSSLICTLLIFDFTSVVNVGSPLHLQLLFLQLSVENVEGKSEFDKILGRLWADAMAKGLFRYQLPDPLPSKVLAGNFRFILQLNQLRAEKRRSPQEIQNMNQPFNPQEFNFNKVSSKEILMQLKPAWQSNDKQRHFLLINVSPLVFGHVLITPFPSSNNPQKISFGGLRLALEVLLLSSNCNFRVGFNSLCGYASVNHEHYHAYYLNHRLFLESVELKPLCDKTGIWELVDYPGQGFVFILENVSNDPCWDYKLEKFVENVVKLTGYLQKSEIAHNMLITRGSTIYQEGHFDCVRIFLWARKSSFGSKQCDAFNPALCELGGYFPCKNENSFLTLTEEIIAELLNDICTKPYHKVRKAILEGCIS